MWAEEGHLVTVLAGMSHYASGVKNPKYKGMYFYDDKNFEPGIRVLRSHVSESYNVNFLGRLWGYFSYVFSSILAGLFKARGSYDIIVVTSPPLFVGITAYVLSKFKRIPFVFEVRDLWPESAIDTGVVTNKFIIKMAYWFESFVYKKAKLINVLTPAFKSVLIEKKKVPEGKIIFIPNAADFSLSEELLKNFDAGDFRKKNGLNGNLVLIYVGAHGVANHLVQVIEAAELLREEHVLFLLIGEGMQKKMLQEEAEKRSLSNVRFVGSVSKKEVFKYILASDMGMSVLKKVDTFKTVYSNKTFDYMSCKKPILMAIDGVSRELVENAHAGSYVEPENAESYNHIIRSYLNNKQRILIEGANGYNYARKNFDRKQLANKYLLHLQDLIKDESKSI